MARLPSIGYVRLIDIIGDRKRNIPALIPVSRSAWWAGVRSGKYPKAVKLGPRTSAWAVEDLYALIARTRAEAAK